METVQMGMKIMVCLLNGQGITAGAIKVFNIVSVGRILWLSDEFH